MAYAPQTKSLPLLSLWIDGAPARASSARAGDVYNPATGEVVRRVPFANKADVDKAVASAKAALPAWRDTPPLKRARILMRFRELMEANRKEMAAIITEEHGKTLADAAGSLQRGIEVIEFATGAPHLLKGEHAEDVGTGVDCHSVLQPVGVCAGVSPFNFPAMVPLWMFPVALACGNTFVLKPSEKVPLSAVRLGELLAECGLPDGVFNLVHGDKECVDALRTHPLVSAISFVGSTNVAKHVYEVGAKHGKRVQAAGGAKNHLIVMPDADLEQAAKAIQAAAFGCAGERCMAGSVAVPVGKIADPLVELVRANAAKMKVGPTDGGANVDMGPVITREHRDKVAGYLEIAKQEGATVALDGRPAMKGDGFLIGPSVLDKVAPTMRVAKEEIFGPVLTVVRAGD